MDDAAKRLRLIKYGILQTTIVPSIICDLLVIMYFIRHWRKEIVNAPQNHVILCLLIVTFSDKITDVPLSLYLYRWGVVFQQTATFCTTWVWWDYSANGITVCLVAWCCIERHLFAFHSQMMKKKWCLILFHYIPIITCLIFGPFFYLAIIVFPTVCMNIWNYTFVFCGGPCYSYTEFWGSFDWIFHFAASILIILFSNLLLFCRFIWQKNQRQQPVRWRRQRRMVIQLGFISLLFLIFMAPETILGVIEALWSPTFGLDIELNYFFFIADFVNQFLPFVIYSSLPAMREELCKWIDCVKKYFVGAIRVHPSRTTVAVGGSHGIAGVRI